MFLGKRFFSIFIFLIQLVPPLAFGQTYSDVALTSGIDFVTVYSDEIFPTQGGVVWFDYDKDFDEDLFLTGGKNGDVLYRNNGDGSFTDVTLASGLDGLDETVYTMGAVSGDIDNDGYRELFVTTEDHDLNRLYYNNGDGTFTDISVSAGVFEGGNSASATFGDVNLDGFLDLYVANWCVEMLNMEIHDTFPTMQNYLYLNNGDLTFEESSEAYDVDDSEGCGLAVTFTDYDNDGDVDLLVGNDFGVLPGNSNNKLFQNQYPSAGFLDVSLATNMDVEMFSMGTAIGDYNEDGLLDYYVTNQGNDALLKREGSGFVYETLDAGLENDSVFCLDATTRRPTYGWGCGFSDFDNDSYLDLFVINGDLHWSYPRPCVDESKMFVNQGDGTFQDETQTLGLSDPYMSRGGAFADYDKDGDIDILIGVSDSIVGNESVRLFRNNQSSGNWISINLEGTIGNRDGFGARVTVKFDGRSLIRECDGGSSFNSHHSSIIHFGLGTAAVIDTIAVQWLGGAVEEYYDVLVNQELTAVEQGNLVAVGETVSSKNNLNLNLFPNPNNGGELKFQITSTVTNQVSLRIKNLLGQEVATIYEGEVKYGNTTGKFNISSELNSGVYYVTLHSGIAMLDVVRLVIVK